MRAFLDSLESQFPDAFRGLSFSSGDGESVIIRIVESSPEAEALRQAIREAERRSLDLCGVSYRFSFEARHHTTAEQRDLLRQLNQDVVDDGPLSRLGLTGAGLGLDAVVVLSAEEQGPVVLAAIQEQHPRFEFELSPRILPRPADFASPAAAAEALLAQLEPVLHDLNSNQISPVEAIRRTSETSDAVLSRGLGVAARDSAYHDAQLVVLEARATVLASIGRSSSDATIIEYAALASEVVAELRDHGPLDYKTGEPRRLFEIAIRLNELDLELGLTPP
jgi:hypothetical protein